jgi:hypothetical protein
VAPEVFGNLFTPVLEYFTASRRNPVIAIFHNLYFSTKNIIYLPAGITSGLADSM